MREVDDAVSVDRGDDCEPVRLEYLAAEDPRMEQASKLRNDVLIEPFGLPPIEWCDDAEASARLAAFEGERMVGYACLIGSGDEQRMRQVTVAFDRHRCGVGSALVRELVEEAQRLGATRLWLAARLPAIPFYERLGFDLMGEEYIEAAVNLPHRHMEYRGR